MTKYKLFQKLADKISDVKRGSYRPEDRNYSNEWEFLYQKIEHEGESYIVYAGYNFSQRKVVAGLHHDVIKPEQQSYVPPVKDKIFKPFQRILEPTKYKDQNGNVKHDKIQYPYDNWSLNDEQEACTQFMHFREIWLRNNKLATYDKQYDTIQEVMNYGISNINVLKNSESSSWHVSRVGRDNVERSETWLRYTVMIGNQKIVCPHIEVYIPADEKTDSSSDFYYAPTGEDSSSNTDMDRDQYISMKVKAMLTKNLV